MGIPFRMVTQHEMIASELCLGGKQGGGETVFSRDGDQAGLQRDAGQSLQADAADVISSPSVSGA